MTMRYRRWHETSIGAAIALLAVSSGAAQPVSPADTESPRSADGAGEIIVTARKRSERLQDVPLSITAISGEELQRAQLNEVRDLGAIVPNLSLQAAAGVETILSIRGIGNNRATQTPRAAVIIDDVPYIDQLSLNGGGLFDIQQVEVLRGPQSTLYGMTAEAGLIVIRTQRPSDTLKGSASALAAHDGEYSGTASLSGPLAPGVLSVGVAAMYGQKNGFIENVLTGKKYNPEERWSLRNQAAVTLADDLDLHLVYAHHAQDNGYGLAYLPVDRAAYNRDFNVEVGKFETAADFQGLGRTNTDEGSLRAAWNMAGAELVSVTAYRDFEGETRIDVDQTPLPFANRFRFATNRFANETFSQEIRLGSTGASPLKWTVGAFYYERRKQIGTEVGLLSGAVMGFGTEARQAFESLSGFGQVTVPLSDRLSLTAGARYEDVEDFGVQTVNYANPAANGTRATLKDSIFLPKVSLDFKPAPGLLIYASSGRGWLPGGVNPSAAAAAQFTFRPERSWSNEIGFKSTLLDGRARLNAAVYRMDIENYQELVRLTAITSAVANASKVRSQGAEVELTARLTPALSIAAALGYNDSHYTDFTDALGSKKGNQLPIFPRYNASVIGTYDFSDDASFRLEWISSGKFYEATDAGHRFGPQSGHDVFNARLSYRYSDALSFSLFANNLLDDRHFVYVQDVTTNGRLFGTPGQARQFGIGASARFP